MDQTAAGIYARSFDLCHFQLSALCYIYKEVISYAYV